MIKLLIFDLDGTIADTIEAIANGLNLTMKNYYYPTHTYEAVKAMVGNGARNLVRTACPEGTFDGNEEFFEEVYQNYCDMYAVTHLDTKECYAGMKEAMLTLKLRGYTLAVLSNKQDPFTKGIVAQLFEGDTISFVQGQTNMPLKPDPTVPLWIASNLGFEPYETAFVGDSDVDIKTGKNAGMTSVAVTWGYRDREKLEALSPDILIDKPEELTEYFA